MVEAVPEKLANFVIDEKSTFIRLSSINSSTRCLEGSLSSAENEKRSRKWSCRVCDMDIQDNVNTSIACDNWYAFAYNKTKSGL